MLRLLPALRRYGSVLASAWLLLLPVSLHADSSLESLQLPDGKLLLNGVGVARQLNEELYVATLYATRPSRNPLELLDARQRRRVQLRIVADRMYPSGAARHFRDLVSLNNARDEVVREAKNLNRFYGLFQQGLMRGDEVILDNVPNKGLVVSINGQTVAEFSSPLMFDLLLRCFIGEKPPTLQFRNQLLGEQDNTARNANLARFAALLPQEERLQAYASVKKPEPEPVETVAAAPEPKPVEAKVTTKPTVAETKPSKPAPSSSKPATSPASTGVASTSKPAAAEVAAREPEPEPEPVVASTAPVSSGIAPGSSTSAVSTPPQKQISADEVASLLQRYEGQLRERLLAGLEYPRREMKRKYGITQMARQKGKIVLRLHLDVGGDINAAWLQERTNEPILDNAALALVDKVAPFPPLPKELPDSAYEFYVPLEFDPDR